MESEEKMVETLVSSNDNVDYMAGVVFDNPKAYETTIPRNISYTLR